MTAYHDALVKTAFTNSAVGRLVHLDWLYRRNFKRVLNAWKMRGAKDIEQSGAVEELRKSGIFIGMPTDFLTKDGLEAFEESAVRIRKHLISDEIQALLKGGRNANNSKDYLVHMVPSDTVHDGTSPFLKLALDPKLLGIVSDYFGMWAKLHSIGSWLNFPVPEAAKMSQLWHRDPADLKLLKVFIYLEDVGVENGPFSFIPETQPFGAASDVVPEHEHRRRITDDEMKVAFPEEKWVACTGPANTMVLADTVGFHRGGKVNSGRRLLITLTYTSGTPQEARELHVSEFPDWASERIQHAALEGVVEQANGT